MKKSDRTQAQLKREKLSCFYAGREAFVEMARELMPEGKALTHHMEATAQFTVPMSNEEGCFLREFMDLTTHPIADVLLVGMTVLKPDFIQSPQLREELQRYLEKWKAQ